MKTKYIRSSSTDKHVSLVEFSLTHSVRDELQDKLIPYVKGNGDMSLLGNIVGDVLGHDIITELHALIEHNPTSQTVYVIHNLPEIEDENAIGFFRNLFATTPPAHKKTFNFHIMEGLQEALGLKVITTDPLVRKFGDTQVHGNNYHNHGTEDVKLVVALGGIVSDGAPTNFLNLHGLAQDDDAHKVEYAANREGTQHPFQISKKETNGVVNLKTMYSCLMRKNLNRK